MIESLPPGDFRSGTALYDDVVFPLTREHPGMHASLVPASDKQTFMRALEKVGDDAARQVRSPIVHIEAHGAAQGVELADGSTVLWAELLPTLTAINRACRMNLLVVAMSCEGWSLTGALMPADRAPVFAVIGPTTTLTAAEIDAATRRFYRALLTSFMLDDALLAMNDGRDFDEWRIKPGTAEILFCRVFREYARELAGADQLRYRENELVASIARRRDSTSFRRRCSGRRFGPPWGPWVVV